MTKAEAIKLIDDRMCFGRGKWSEHQMPEIDDYWKAGQIAIKALEEPERKPGEWIPHHEENPLDGSRGGVTCSNCGWKTHNKMHLLMGCSYRFCPNCGCDMRGTEND